MQLTTLEKEYIRELYANTNGFVKLMCRHNRKGIFIPSSAFASNPEKYINCSRIKPTNTMMSLSTFRKKGAATAERINTVCAIAIDIDYRFMENGELLDSQKAYKKLTEDCLAADIFLPIPTYVEYGHRLRFIYLFDTPVCLNTTTKTRRSVLVLLERIGKEICDSINALDSKWNAEIQQATKFVRVPESINIRFAPTSDGRYYPEYKYIIGIIKPSNSHKWSLQELADYCLPSLPDWYGNWKARKSKKKKAGKKAYGLIPMLDSRLELLDRLQKLGYGCGYRETMCFLHWNFCLQKNLSAEEALESTKEFNSRFSIPLRERELVSNARPRKTYFYSNRKLIDIFSLSPELSSSLSNFNKKQYDRHYSRLRRKKEYMEKKKAGLLKCQRIEKAVAKAKELREKGFTLVSISSLLSLSLSTIKRYLAKA